MKLSRVMMLATIATVSVSMLSVALAYDSIETIETNLLSEEYATENTVTKPDTSPVTLTTEMMTETTVTTTQTPVAVPQNTEANYQQYPASYQMPAPQSQYQTPQQATIRKTAEDYLAIDANPASLHKYSKKKYAAYAITVKNTSSNSVELMSVQVTNGLDEELLAQEKQASGNKKRKIGGFLLRGGSAALSMLPLAGGVGSYAGNVAAAQANGAVHYAAMAVDNVPTGAAQASEGYVNRFNSVMVATDGSFTFTTVVPKSETPHYTVIVKDLSTNQIYDLKQ